MPTRKVRRLSGPFLISFAALVALSWFLSGLLDVFLLGFAGVLLALLLQGSGAWLASRLGVAERWGTAAFCLIVAAAMTVSGFLVAPAIAEQLDELGRELPKAATRATTTLEGYDWGERVIRRIHRLDDLLLRQETMTRAEGVLSTSLGAIAGAVTFLFLGLFVAFEPRLYRDGLLRLAPQSRRERLNEVLDETAQTLRLWMAGKFFAMLVVGVLTWVGLMLLQVPLGLTLALLAAVLTFIPNFGPVLSAIPAVLLGLLDGPDRALHVVLLYVGVQTVESYILTPLVQKKTASLPPAITLLGQVVMGVLAGGLGVVVATPLTAVVIVLVKRFYVEDVLGDDLDRKIP